MESTGMIFFKTSTVQSLQVTWKIPDYFSLPDTYNYLLHTPPFIFSNATWCLRLYPNDPTGMKVAPVRLHSLVSHHKIITKFVAKVGEVPKNEEDNYFEGGYLCTKLSYDELNVERKYFLPEASRTSQFFSLWNKKTVIPLELVCHLLEEDGTDDDAIIQKCEKDFSKIYDRSGEKDPNTMSLESSKAKFFKITWKIPEYFSFPTTPGHSFDSPSFDLGDATWFLKLYPNGMDDNSDFSVSLVRSHSSVSCHKIICKFFIMADEKEIETNYIYEDFEFLTNRERKFRDDNFEIPSRSALFQNRNKFAPNDKVTFLCHIFYEESTENHEEQSIHYHKELDEYKAVCQDMRNLLLNGGDHDLILKVKDREFPVHRHILRARSSVFKAMLRHDMIQENNGVVDVPDCDPQVMEQFLLYIYCGKVDELNESNVMGLYLAAQKYDKISLKKTCRDFMRNSLSRANICDIIQLAKNDYDKTLLEYATEYFINNINDILPTLEWISFLTANTAAANELLIKASKKWTDENIMLMKKGD